MTIGLLSLGFNTTFLSQTMSQSDIPVIDDDSADTRLRECIEELRGTGELPDTECRALAERLAAKEFHLVVVGQFKRGKTSVINALIGEDLLPVGVIPLTSIVTVLEYGESEDVRVRFYDGSEDSVPARDLKSYVTEKGNPGNEKGVGEVVVTSPSPWLRRGVRLVDTPGIGSVYQHNTDEALRFLPRADAVLLVLSAEQPVSKAESDFLKSLAQYAGRIFLVFNKADILDPCELEESTSFASDAVAAALGTGAPLYPVSAKLARESCIEDSQTKLARSGFPPFSAALREFLNSGKGNAVAASVGYALLRLISQVRFSREFSIKALSEPVDQIRSKLERFEVRSRELLVARDEYALILNGECGRLLHDVVEPDLRKFEDELVELTAASVEKCFRENKDLPSAKLQNKLKRTALGEIRRAFDLWRASEDEKIAKAFADLCERVASRADAAVDDLYRFSSELFSVPYEEIRARFLWVRESRFYYKFWEELPSLALLASGAVLALPKLIGDRIILHRARNFAVAAVRTQSGRVRYDFQKRLEDSRRTFQARMGEYLAAVIGDLEQALDQTMAARLDGEAEAERRRAELSVSLQRLERAREAVECLLGELKDPKD